MPSRSAPGLAFVAALSALLLAYNAAIFLVPTYPVLYVPLNVSSAVLLLLLARRVGLRRPELGLAPEAASRGLAVGGAVLAGAALLAVIAVAVPALHPLLEDRRIEGIGIGLLAYRTLVRIPFGTALLEEVAFRGVLLAGWARAAGPLRGVLGSSAVFGLWHVRPALDLVAINAPGAAGPEQAAIVAGAVAFTAAGGLFFAWLRLRSGSLLAPLLAHAGINSVATVAAYLVR